MNLRYIKINILLLAIAVLSCSDGGRGFSNNEINKFPDELKEECDHTIDESTQNDFIEKFQKLNLKILGVTHMLYDPCEEDANGSPVHPENWQCNKAGECSCTAGKSAPAIHNIIESVMRRKPDFDGKTDDNVYEYKISDDDYGTFLTGFVNLINKYKLEFFFSDKAVTEYDEIKVFLDGEEISDDKYRIQKAGNNIYIEIINESTLAGKSEIKIVYDPYNQIEGDYVRDSDYIIKLPMYIHKEEKVHVFIDGIEIEKSFYTIDNTIPAIILDKEKVKLKIGSRVRVKLR